MPILEAITSASIFSSVANAIASYESAVVIGAASAGLAQHHIMLKQGGLSMTWWIVIGVLVVLAAGGLYWNYLLGRVQSGTAGKLYGYPKTGIPTIDWYKGYNGSQEESKGNYIISCSDGGYLQVGEAGAIPDTAILLVVKVDASGDLVWQKEFGTAGNNIGTSALEIADGYIITGGLNEDSLIMKLAKADGATTWSTTTDLGGNDALENVVELPDNTFAAVGYNNAEDNTNTFYTAGQGILVFYAADGTKTSEVDINAKMSQGYRIQTDDTNLYIAGLTAGAQDFALLKTDLAGAEVWYKTYGGDNYDHMFAFDLNSNGNMVMSGHTLSGTKNWDTHTVMVDSTGTQQWAKTVGNPRGFDESYIHDEAWGVQFTSDGGCVVIAGTGDEYWYFNECNDDTGCSNTWQVYLIKFDSAGTVEYQALYGYEDGAHFAGEDITIDANGDFMVAVDDGTFGFLKLTPPA